MSILSLDPTALIHTAGVLGVAVIVFLESGIPFGFFFPGDSLLFTAGLLSSQGYLSPLFLFSALPIAAILGDSVGYWFGHIAGASLSTRPRFFVRPEHLKRTEEFFAKYGTRAVILARFVPVVRTFTPILAGAGSMKYGLFLRYNVIGGILWSIGITGVGYYLGTLFPGAQSYLLPISLGIVLISFIPIAVELLRASGTREPRG